MIGMLAFVFGWWQLPTFTVSLVALAVFFAWMQWRTAAIVTGVIAAAFFVNGMSYQEGEWACERRVAAERIRIERLWADNVAKINAEHRAEVDQLEAGKAEADKALADLEVAQAARPAAERCTLSESDARAINAR